jgi:hypothetical protein
MCSIMRLFFVINQETRERRITDGGELRRQKEKLRTRWFALGALRLES